MLCGLTVLATAARAAGICPPKKVSHDTAQVGPEVILRRRDVSTASIHPFPVVPRELPQYESVSYLRARHSRISSFRLAPHRTGAKLEMTAKSIPHPTRITMTTCSWCASIHDADSRRFLNAQDHALPSQEACERWPGNGTGVSVRSDADRCPLQSSQSRAKTRRHSGRCPLLI